MPVELNVVSEVRQFTTLSGRTVYVLDGQSGFDLDALVAACNSKACAPPPVGTGGSLPSGSGSKFAPKNRANPDASIGNGLEVLNNPDSLAVKEGFIDNMEKLWRTRMPKNPSVRTRVPISALEGIAKDKKFKTQHETETSQGLFDPEFRERVERRMFGSAIRRLPYYGYMAERGGKSAFGEDNTSSAGGYGDIVIEFKPEVNQRTTMTLGDSFASKLAPLPVDDIWNVSKERRYLATGSAWGYIEAQIHDPLTVKDVERIYVWTGTLDFSYQESLGNEGDTGDDRTVRQVLTKMFPDAEIVGVDDLYESQQFSVCELHEEFACNSKACAPPPVGRGGSLPSPAGTSVHGTDWEQGSARLVGAMSRSLSVKEMQGLDDLEMVYEAQVQWGKDQTRINAKVRSNLLIRERVLEDPEFIKGVGKLLDIPSSKLIRISLHDLDAMYNPAVATINMLARITNIGHVFPMSQQLKEIADVVPLRTKQDPTLRDFIDAIQRQMPDEFTEDGASRIGDLTPEQFASSAVVAAMIDSWANTSMGTSMSIAHQLAGAELHGINANKFISEYRDLGKNGPLDGFDIQNGRAFFEQHRDLLVSMARAEYEVTQEFLSRAGIKEVTVYRGVKFVDPLESDGKKVAVGDTIRSGSNALSSWSIDPDMGKQFAEDMGVKFGFKGKPRTHGYVMGMKVPASMVQALPTSGRGCLEEFEVILIGHPSEVGIVEYIPKVDTVTASGAFVAVH